MAIPITDAVITGISIFVTIPIVITGRDWRAVMVDILTTITAGISGNPGRAMVPGLTRARIVNPGIALASPAVTNRRGTAATSCVGQAPAIATAAGRGAATIRGAVARVISSQARDLQDPIHSARAPSDRTESILTRTRTCAIS